MNGKWDEVIAKTERDIEKLRQGMETARRLADLPGLRAVTHAFISNIGGDVFISTAYDLKTYRHNRRVLYLAGWRITGATVVGDGDRRQSYLKKDNAGGITYCMNTATTGSTCTRTKVAEVAQAVYEVVCK